MRAILIIVLLLTLVKLYLFEMYPDPFDYEAPPDEYLPEDYFQPKRMEPPMPCIRPYKECLMQLRQQRMDQNSICGYDKKIGLINFMNICQLHLQNCFGKPEGGNHKFGEKYADDIIYYNGQNYTCLYYVKKTTDYEELISLYFKEAKKDDNDNNI